MDFLIPFFIILALANLLFSGSRYFYALEEKPSFSYLFLSIFASMWSLTALLTAFSAIPFEYLVTVTYLHYLSGYAASLAFFWFALRLVPHSRSLIAAAAGCSLLTAISVVAAMAATPSFIHFAGKGPIAHTLSFDPISYGVFSLVLGVLFIAGIGMLFTTWLQHRTTDRHDRPPSYWILLIAATILLGGAGFSLNVIAPFFGIFDYFYINPILVTLFLAGVHGFNLIRYHVFNVRVILAELFTFAIWAVLTVRIVVAKDLEEGLINSVFLFLAVIFGMFLIKSVAQEVIQRERSEQLAKDLESANTRLKELDRQKSEFVSIASHQLRSPLTAIKGYASMALEGSFGEVPAEAKKALDRIYESSNLMASSVDDFLNVSRIEQGRMTYNKTDFDLAELARTVSEELRPTAEKKGLRLEFKADGQELYPVHADLGKVKQVIQNLLDNAIKYTPEGDVRLEVSRPGNASVVRLAISDSGVGISKETLPVLFEKFTRARDAHTINASGTGLGLYVAKQMVEAHGGKIWAESPGEGKGSTFFIELAAVAA